MNMEHGIPTSSVPKSGLPVFGDLHNQDYLDTAPPPPLSNSWIISIICLYIALKRIPNMDCYWVGGGGGQYPIYNIGVPLFMDSHVSHPFGEVVACHVCRGEGPTAYDEKTTTPA